MSASRTKLNNILEPNLPLGFTTDPHDNFINHTPEGITTGCRVIRVVGKQRMLVLFAFDNDQFEHSYRRKYKTLYLNEQNELVEFNADMAQPEWCRAHNKPQNFGIGWDTYMGWWLRQNGAMTFTGRGWAESCAMKVQNLIRRWQRHYSGGSWRSGNGVWSDKGSFTDAEGHEYG
jgi:hypothetical protein